MKEQFKVPESKTCLVTGVAGFIGSHLAHRLLDEGCRVIGVDCFTDYYDHKIKEKNIIDLMERPDFEIIRADITELDQSILDDVQWVFHQAAQAGVRASWGEEFADYTHHNILATQRLLEWASRAKPERFIYASSSSVYGVSGKLPMHEEDTPKPLSPYGVTKLAAEHLCGLYHQNFGVASVSLRYFTVYGPKQRPDMAFHRFIRAIIDDEEIIIYGTGEQTRDFTYIGDVVEVNLAAALTPASVGRVYNIGGGTRISVNGVLELLKKISGKEFKVRHEPVQAGDPMHTYADTTRARKELKFTPQTTLEQGLTQMIDSLK